MKIIPLLLFTAALLASGIPAQETAMFAPAVASVSPLLDPQAVWDDHPNFRRALAIPALLRHADLEVFLRDFLAETDGLFTDEVVTHSVEGRAIHHLTFGHGPTQVLIWARQHGDEPLSTASVMDLLGFLADRRDSPAARAIAENLTLHIVPMVNPDGAERFTRRNAQGIDPNRDARLRQSPGAQALRSLFERFRPAVCFNLHDQSPRKSTDRTGELIALSLQACPFDMEETEAPHLVRAKRVCGLMVKTLEPWIGGHIGRYDVNYMSRAFGDSMSRWGVASILIEAGGWFGADQESVDFIARCHFLALLSGVVGVASGAEETIAPVLYDELPLEGEPHHDLVIRDVTILNGTGLRPHRGDIAIDRRVDHRAGGTMSGSVRAVGDVSVFRGRSEIKGEALVATPGLVGFDPDFHPADLGDRARLISYLRRGITTVVGRWDESSGEAVHLPTSETPLRVIFLEPVANGREAVARAYLTDAHGLLLRCTVGDAEALVATLPSFAGLDPRAPLDLILVNRGRPVENHALALISSARHEQAEALDLETTRRAFANWRPGAVVGAAGLAAQPVLFMSPAPEAPTLATLMEQAEESESWTPPTLIQALTLSAAHALDLRGQGRIWRGDAADIVLWAEETGSSDPIQLGAVRHVIVAGHEVSLD